MNLKILLPQSDFEWFMWGVLTMLMLDAYVMGDPATADPSDRPDYAILDECDLQTLDTGDSQTVQTGQGDLVRLEAVEDDSDE